MPIDSVVKVSGAIVANTSTDDIASVDMQEDGEIVCVGGAIRGEYLNTAIAMDLGHNPTLIGELSFLSTNQIGSNDARGSIAGLVMSSYLFFQDTTGGGGCPLSVMESICLEGGISVNAGERIHLHGLSNMADLTGIATFLLYIKTRGGARRATKRR